MNKVNLNEIVGGALQEQFARSFERVVDNLQNPNTPFKNVREITIKLKFTQNEKRDDVKCSINVSEKLAAQAATETSFAIGKDLQTGELYAEEYGKQIRGQMNLKDYETPVQKIGGDVVDTETGEILKSDTVVDFRKAQAQ